MDKENSAQDQEQPAYQQSAEEEPQLEPDQKDDKMDNYQSVLNQSKSGKKKLITAAVIIVIVLITLWVAKSFFGSSQPVPTQAPTPTPTPSLTPKQQLIRSEWNLEVLNGSGITGQAKKVADKLKEMGYKVTKTGNADKDNYDSSQIFISSAFKDKVDLLVADIKDAIKIASVAGELKDSTASARIFIGKD